MKRTRSKEEFESIERNTRDKINSSSADNLNECSVNEFQHVRPGNGVKESDEFVANKLREIEHEIDKLSAGKSKEAYFIAVKQEIKQQTHYVRSKEFLLLFLRTEIFDARKAALRLVEFLKYKLELFGEEKLPRRIKQDDLSEDDKRALLSGWYHFDLDRKGRLVTLFQVDLLLVAGLLHERYINNILRATMYQIMYALENNDGHKNEAVGIRWSLDPTSTVSLKNHRLFFFVSSRLCLFAMPIRCVAMHNCLGNDLSRMCGVWVESFLRRYSQHLFRMHGPSVATCFAELSKYGIDVKSLPLTSNGNFNESVHLQNVERMLLNEKENECNKIKVEKAKVENSAIGEGVDVSPTGCFKDQLPHKLMQLLQINHYPDALWWSSDGRSFLFHKEKLCKSILLKEFNGIKLNSFLRNLRRWGFQRILYIGEGRASTILKYHNDLFQRDAPHLLYDYDPINTENQKSGEKSHKKDKFPITLKKLLDSNEMSDTLWWECDETAIAFDKQRIENVMLVKYFKGLKLDSFFRNLRRWGFKRLYVEENKLDNNVVIFKHVLFQKDLSLSPDRLEKFNETAEGRGEQFFAKLHRILDANHTSAIWWNEGGNSFAIHKERFANEILPQEYNGVKIASFLRHLKRWGFENVESHGNITIYQHNSFKRESPNIAGVT